MPKRTGSFDSWQAEKLSDPALATRYLTAVLEEAPEQFLAALGNVARASQMSVVAKKSGVAREHLYQSLSDKGNVTWSTLLPVLKALGLRLSGVVTERGASAVPSSSSGVAGTRKLRRRYGRHGLTSAPAQLTLPFDRVAFANTASATVNVARVGNIAIAADILQQGHFGTLRVPRVDSQIRSDQWIPYQSNQQAAIPTYAYAQ